MSIRFIRHDNFGGNYITIYRFVSEISVHPRLPKKVKNVARTLKNFINDSKINPKQYNLSMQPGESTNTVRLELLSQGSTFSAGLVPGVGCNKSGQYIYNKAELGIANPIECYKQVILNMIQDTGLKQNGNQTIGNYNNSQCMNKSPVLFVQNSLPDKPQEAANILRRYIRDPKINPKGYDVSMQRSGDIVRLMLLNRGQIPSSGRFPHPGYNESENVAKLKITASINRYKQAIRAMVANAELNNKIN